MKFFLDTEFIEDGRTIDLVSIGVVAEDGREFYAVSTEFDPGVTDAVISELPEQKRIEGLGGSMRLGGQDVLLKPGTLAHFLAGGRTQVRERFRHRYEVEPAFV